MRDDVGWVGIGSRNGDGDRSGGGGCCGGGNRRGSRGGCGCRCGEGGGMVMGDNGVVRPWWGHDG